MGTRGLVGLNVRDNKDPLNTWFVSEYKKDIKHGLWVHHINMLEA